MGWLIIPNIIWLFDFESLRLHFFSYILYAYIAHMFLFIGIYLCTKQAGLNFHSRRSLNFTDWFTVLGLNFKYAVLRNYCSDLVQIYVFTNT